MTNQTNVPPSDPELEQIFQQHLSHLASRAHVSFGIADVMSETENTNQSHRRPMYLLAVAATAVLVGALVAALISTQDGLISNPVDPALEQVDNTTEDSSDTSTAKEPKPVNDKENETGPPASETNGELSTPDSPDGSSTTKDSSSPESDVEQETQSEESGNEGDDTSQEPDSQDSISNEDVSRYPKVRAYITDDINHNIEWNKPTNPKGEVRYYLIEERYDGSDEWSERRVGAGETVFITNSGSYLTFTYQSQEIIDVRVTAVTDEGSWTTETRTETPSVREPGAPANVLVEATGSRLDVTWQEPDNGGPATVYWIFLRPEDAQSSKFEENLDLAPETRSYSFDVVPGVYFIDVVAVNPAGNQTTTIRVDAADG